MWFGDFNADEHWAILVVMVGMCTEFRPPPVTFPCGVEGGARSGTYHLAERAPRELARPMQTLCRSRDVQFEALTKGRA